MIVFSTMVTMRSASTVDGAVEAACAGDSHGAQTPVSAKCRSAEAGRAAGATAHRHPGPWTAAVLRSALTALSTFSRAFVRITRSTSRLWDVPRQYRRVQTVDSIHYCVQLY